MSTPAFISATDCQADRTDSISKVPLQSASTAAPRASCRPWWIDWSCLALSQCTLLVSARLGFEPRACGGGLPLRVPHPQPLGHTVCAAVLEPLPLLMLARLLICSVHNAPLHVNSSWLAWRPGRVRQVPLLSTPFWRGLRFPRSEARGSIHFARRDYDLAIEQIDIRSAAHTLVRSAHGCTPWVRVPSVRRRSSCSSSSSSIASSPGVRCCALPLDD